VQVRVGADRQQRSVDREAGDHVAVALVELLMLLIRRIIHALTCPITCTGATSVTTTLQRALKL